MPFELLHFRGAEKILKRKTWIRWLRLLANRSKRFSMGLYAKGDCFAKPWMNLTGDKIQRKLKILPGRQYAFKGWRNGIAIDGNFASYEAIWDSL